MERVKLDAKDVELITKMPFWQALLQDLDNQIAAKQGQMLEPAKNYGDYMELVGAVKALKQVKDFPKRALAHTKKR